MGNKLVIFSCSIVAVLGVVGCSSPSHSEAGTIENAPSHSVAQTNEPTETPSAEPSPSMTTPPTEVVELTEEDKTFMSQKLHEKLKLLVWDDLNKSQVVVDHFFGYDYHLKPLYAVNITFPDYTVQTIRKEAVQGPNEQKIYDKYAFELVSASGQKLATVAGYWLDDTDSFKIVQAQLSDYALPRVSPSIIGK